MLDLFETMMNELPALLGEAGAWRGMRIDYHPPFVDRVWRPWRDCRISLHRIWPCAPGEALLHPHPWPSAMRVLAGRYEMAVGHGAGIVPPPIAMRVIAVPGTTYAMTDRDAWHDVRPLGGPAVTVMLSGVPWQREMPLEPEAPQRALDAAAVAEMLATVRGILAA